MTHPAVPAAPPIHSAISRRRLASIVLIVALGLAAAGVAVLGAAGWYYAGQINGRALAVDHSPDALNILVSDVSGDTVTLEPAPGRKPGDYWRTRGTFGLQWPGGYGQVTEILDDADGRVIRRFAPLAGELHAGTLVHVDAFAYPGDPRTAFGYDFTEIILETARGAAPAWFVDAPANHWAILVHGRAAPRREMLRQLRTLHESGLKTLTITYLNDPDAPASPDARYHFGQDEWPDLQVAVEYALDHGAGSVTLVGNSMGASIIMAFLRQSPLAPDIGGVILDSPMLDFGAAVESQAPSFVPSLVVETGKWLASVRYGVDWQALDYLDDLSGLRVPVLLFHGEEDSDVPVSISDRLAAARPDLVTYLRIPGARHVTSWNTAPEAYESALRRFAERVTSGE